MGVYNAGTLEPLRSKESPLQPLMFCLLSPVKDILYQVVTFYICYSTKRSVAESLNI